MGGREGMDVAVKERVGPSAQRGPAGRPVRLSADPTRKTDTPTAHRTVTSGPLNPLGAPFVDWIYTIQTTVLIS